MNVKIAVTLDTKEFDALFAAVDAHLDFLTSDAGYPGATEQRDNLRSAWTKISQTCEAA